MDRGPRPRRRPCRDARPSLRSALESCEPPVRARARARRARAGGLGAAGERALALSAFALGHRLSSRTRSRSVPRMTRPAAALPRSTPAPCSGLAATAQLVDRSARRLSCGGRMPREWPKRRRSRRVTPGSPGTERRPTGTSPPRSRRWPSHPPSRGKVACADAADRLPHARRPLRAVDHRGRRGARWSTCSGWTPARAPAHRRRLCPLLPRRSAGLDEIEDGIAVAGASGAAEMQSTGYLNLSSELHFFGRLDEARRAWRTLRGDCRALRARPLCAQRTSRSYRLGVCGRPLGRRGGDRG